MKIILLGAFLVMAACLVNVPAWAADSYSLDAVHSSVGFSIRHMMVAKVNGGFNDFKSDLKFDPADLVDSKFDFVIQVASIDTRNESRDNNLRGTDFFEADKYPTITFKTSKVEKTEGNTYAVTGDLTMKNVVKSVIIPVTVYGPVFNPMVKADAIGIEAAFKINRQDYGLTWNKALDNGGWVLDNEVNAFVNIEAHKTVK